ncbi:MAG: hypothetical protein NC218_07285 [Acetobacter sp.]|nr:hypothetical protein [Acetobacter sp.]
MARESEAEAIKRIQAGLKCTEEEAREVYAYDKAIDRGEKTEFDLTAEQEKASRKYARADRKPTVYNLTKRERKPNATKGAIIAALAAWLTEGATFEVDGLEITNKERQVKFSSAGETFELTLVQKRKPKS